MKKILIVDDDPVSAFLTKKVISKIHFAIPISVAKNAEAAISLLKEYFDETQSLPDVIVLDLSMPIMNGFEFIHEFYSLNIAGIHQVKIVVLSSTLDENDFIEAQRLGVYRFLAKPIEEKSLRVILGEL